MDRSEHVFHYRLDTYWRSVAIYAVALLLYGVGRSLIAGTLQSDGRIEVVLADPIFWLLSAFVLVSAAALGVNILLQRRIVVLPDVLIFATRFRQRRLERSAIRRVVIRRERAGWRLLRSVRIYQRGRRLPIRIRPSFYDRERELFELLVQLRPPAGEASRTARKL
ncbi:MAG: hypothetical protein D6747_02990 [Chlorobiota bacterium]|jgi:hypothetical protein|nr:MAG: hypothetical protein D6747_02990 [Chlorobiota bacterium]